MHPSSFPSVGCGLRRSAATALLSLTLAFGSARAQSSQFSVVHQFSNAGDNGAHSLSGLIQGGDGNFYGTTTRGGNSNDGSVFRLSPGGDFSVLYSFGDNRFGGEPIGALTAGPGGYFYGTTQFGGYYGEGEAFVITSGGALTVLFDFGGDYGSQPVTSLTLGTDGNFYGTTEYGGYYNNGTVFQMTPDGTVNVLYDFGGDDGSGPEAALVLGTDGFFYGTTADGGLYGNGTVFQISTAGALTVLHDFRGDEGATPIGALVQLPDGTFYGTASVGGADDYGTVFQITTAGTFTKLHDFDGADGSDPQAALVQAGDGNFYGTTYYGGLNDEGTVYEISPATGAFASLLSFSRAAGQYPGGPLLLASDGALYGTTFAGGPSDDGVVFRDSIVPAPVAVTLAVQGSDTAAAGGKVKVVITRTGSTDAAMSVAYQLKGSAHNGTDYRALSGTATIPAGADSVTLKVKSITAVSAKTVKIRLMAPADGAYTVGEPAKVVVRLAGS